MGIFTRLADFDGKSIVVLEGIKRSTEVNSALLGELVEISGGEDRNMQIAATWLIRAYLKDGARLSPEQVERFGGFLCEMQDGFARLHVCQCMSLVEVGEAQAEVFAEFFRECVESKNTFLRAWAPSGLWRLADQFPRFREEARRLIEKALTDPAASVRARARRTLAGE